MTGVSEIDKPLYIFIDESGNFDFTSKGTKYFSMTAVVTTDPVSGRDSLIGLRYSLLGKGINQETFHATEDTQYVRDEVYKIIKGLSNFEVHSIIAQKNKTHSSLYEDYYYKKGRMITNISGMGLYRWLGQVLLKYIFQGKKDKFNKLIVVMGAIYTGDKKKTILKTIKTYLKDNFPGVPFEIYCHQSCSDLNCQIADYCCWAIAIKWERGEVRPYEILRNRIRSEFDIFKKGTTEYYQYNKTTTPSIPCGKSPGALIEEVEPLSKL